MEQVSVDQQELLEFRGDTPPQSIHWSDQDWFAIPHQHYIPFSLAQFKRTIFELPKVQKQREVFGQFLRHMELLFHTHYYHLMQELKEDYEYFSLESGKKLRGSLKQEELLFRQHRFLSNFLNAMERGNFSPFTESSYTQAMEHDYLVDLPVVFDWSKYDNRLFSKFPNVPMPKAFHGSAWLFYRGIDVEREEGVYVVEKATLWLDQILSWVLSPLRWFWRRTQEGTSERVVAKDTSSSLGNQNASHGFRSRWVRRLNLRNQHHRIRDMLKTTKLQEPAFERLVCLYRFRPLRRPSWTEKIPVFQEVVQRFFPPDPMEETDWTIHLKVFHHIPLADSEMVLPNKSIQIKQADRLFLYLLGFAGLFTMIRGWYQSGSTMFFVLMGVFIAYSSKILFGYRRTRARYLANVIDLLYRKNRDNDVGVLEYLVDGLEEQDLKEALLVYCVLWLAQKPLTREQLDRAVEDFLCTYFSGVEIDFEIDDALQKVTASMSEMEVWRIPIVEITKDPKGCMLYKAVALQEAKQTMEMMWHSFFEE